jgi:hypothetical protein
MVSHQIIGLTRIIKMVDLNATTMSYNSIKLNAQSKQNIKQRFKIKNKGHLFDAPGLALLTTMLAS